MRVPYDVSWRAVDKGRAFDGMVPSKSARRLVRTGLAHRHAFPTGLRWRSPDRGRERPGLHRRVTCVSDSICGNALAIGLYASGMSGLGL